MNIIKKIKQYFQSEAPIDLTHEREMRQLLRENLKTISVDVFYYDDPLNKLAGPDRKAYLQYFYELSIDTKFIDRMKFHINKQANVTLKNSKDGTLDTAGVMKMDGMGTVKDDVERLAAMFLKEQSELGGKPSRSREDSLRGI